ncbi:MucR family transcriptional regulator [Mesorhizobium sp. IMUNJ 23232]|uniref:MucR family transcriptional regulator n=1 Tax=Mesorhizobium sp. IMUNJ 23232 TaxID=3376064 RepID=UPI0037A813D0
MTGQDELIELTADIVAAYVANNPVPAADLAALIASLHSTLASLADAKGPEPEAKEPQKPFVNPKKSVHPDHIVCLEDGKKFSSLKRHLMTSHGMTPEAYRQKWNLGPEYPMTAPDYSVRRSELAKAIGLGTPSAPEPEPAKRGRAKKARAN